MTNVLSDQHKTVIYDRLYGCIEVTGEELRLFQTKELARLRQVSLSAVPTWTIPTGVCSSKFEHSVGVAHLAKIVGAKKEFEEIARDLYFAGLAHDIGTPPFSHASEYFQVKLLKRNHEYFSMEVLDGSEFAREVTAQGGNIERVIDFIVGRTPPFSDIVNGSIDVDNLDNSLRFGLSMGLLTKPLYNPQHLATAYTSDGNRVMLREGYTADLKGWEQTRRVIYDYIYSEANLSPGMMLYRALDFARRENELPKEFFFMTDATAYYYLSNKCNPRTKLLMERAARWQWYPRVFTWSTTTPTSTLAAFLTNSDNRDIMADDIASSLGIAPEDIAIHMGKDKGFKKIHLPIVGSDRSEYLHEPEQELRYMVQAYVHPSQRSKQPAIHEYLTHRLNRL